MLQLVYRIRHYFEKRGFYVCSRLADRLGMRAKSVRLFFIYVSFATMGVGFAIYLTIAFLLKLKDLLFTKRTSVFDL
ncbi:PspC domain-containing protein [Altibacter sp.]|uniref:PspC domain-containing protein n=1 Tax=Altibacter sp. TaxID=2024823 RepID=UPI000C98D635|nr:PspC domain-containing protein [Altibacter sp.]MAP54572.1 PspC family transcriptional regulator [Altibacter sp.]